MGPTDLALEAAAYIIASGTNDDGSLASLSAAQARRIANDLTATMQDIYSSAPSIFKRLTGVNLRGPSVANVTFGEPGTEFASATVVAESATDAEGIMAYQGLDDAGHAFFVRKAEPSWELLYASGAWSLRQVSQSAPIAQWSLIRSAAAPDGVYAPSGVASGNVTITSTLANTSGVDTDFAFMEGGSIRYDSTLNEIYTGPSGPQTVFPYTGASGAVVPVTFYDDSILLGPDIASVSTVVANGRYPLYHAASRTDFRHSRPYLKDYGIYGDYGTIRFDCPHLTASRPCEYWVEPFIVAGVDQVSQLRLRVSPMPSAPCRLSFEAMVNAPTFTVDDLGTDDTPSTRTFCVPMNYVESIVRPIFLKKWAGSPWAKLDNNVLQRINEEDQAARIRLQSYAFQSATTVATMVSYLP